MQDGGSRKIEHHPVPGKSEPDHGRRVFAFCVPSWFGACRRLLYKHKAQAYLPEGCIESALSGEFNQVGILSGLLAPQLHP
jgi:hypothetical protein